jgi:uncharacterized protein (DUF433 family)
MTEDELLELLSVDAEVCHGQPCIRGARVLVTVVLDSLAAGKSVTDIVEDYPSVTAEGVRAAAAYGAWLARQEVHPPRSLSAVKFTARRQCPRRR